MQNNRFFSLLQTKNALLIAALAVVMIAGVLNRISARVTARQQALAQDQPVISYEPANGTQLIAGRPQTVRFFVNDARRITTDGIELVFEVSSSTVATADASLANVMGNGLTLESVIDDQAVSEGFLVRTISKPAADNQLATMTDRVALFDLTFTPAAPGSVTITFRQTNALAVLGASTDQESSALPSVSFGVVPLDRDNDGVPDAQDNCRALPNPEQLDIDRDHQGDACDGSPEGPDTDQDAIYDLTDNCPFDKNLDQKDTDSDLFGDTCDPTPLGHDIDNDKRPSTKDNCPIVPNPDQKDEDKDGTGDVCDDATEQIEFMQKIFAQ